MTINRKEKVAERIVRWNWAQSKVPSHEDVWESGHKGPRILNLDTIWRWVVSFTLRPLHSRGKGPQYLSDKRMGEPQGHLDVVGKRKMCWTWRSHTGDYGQYDLPAVTPCNPVGVHWRFGGKYRFHLQVRIISQKAACCLLLAGFTLWPWRRRQIVLAKHQWFSTELRGFTTWKIILFRRICCTYRGSNSDSAVV
jgi:hypothetical protein